MNERIQELTKQAVVREVYYPAENNGHPEYQSYVSQENQEKFGEWFIKECCDCDRVIDELGLSKEESDALKKHFGVEE